MKRLESKFIRWTCAESPTSRAHDQQLRRAQVARGRALHRGREDNPVRGVLELTRKHARVKTGMPRGGC